jgi:hypothetical protein
MQLPRQRRADNVDRDARGWVEVLACLDVRVNVGTPTGTRSVVGRRVDHFQVGRVDTGEERREVCLYRLASY